MLTIGVTGGIGSGKTTVTDMFAQLRITVVDSDIIARTVVDKGSRCLKKITEHFGPSILLPDGSLNRSKLRELIFTQPSEKKWLENLTHPAIRSATLTALNNAEGPYVILSSPLLFETQQDSIVDRVLVVDIAECEQSNRAALRDGVPVKNIEAIISQQINRQQRLAKADDIIDNSGPLEATHAQVQKLHQYYLSLL